ncbi:MAG: hypothetical protein ACXAEU_04505 [Candidatus Hodarchaeales archaeon]
MERISAINLSLIWGNLRNLIDFDTVEIPSDFKIIGTIAGEFPVDDYHPIFLEVPRTRKKINISGRSNHRVSPGISKNKWYFRRIISLPTYEFSENVKSNFLDIFYQFWGRSLIPEEIPCSALAIKTKGHYCDVREGQNIIVLLIWIDKTARILELDWFEGPLEDCITPEWYIKSSELLSLKNGFVKLKDACSSPTGWFNPTFTLFVIPSCLGTALLGEKNETCQKGWIYEWNYCDHLALVKDLDYILNEIKVILRV